MERRRALLVLAVACILAVAGLTSVAPGAVAAPGDYGYQDGSFSGVTNPPTSDKPQSKLWYNDGSWWAVMFNATTLDWRIYRLDRGAETWVNTGVPVDPRKQTLSDVLWDGNKLYVATNWVTVSTDTAPKAALAKPSRLYRYSYSSATGTYTLDPGFPSTIGPTSSESLTIDEDSTGRIWATWTKVTGDSTAGFTNQVYVNSSADGSTWGTPMVLPVNDGSTTVAPDDISSVIAYGRAKNPYIGVLYSNQLDGSVYWATHRDGAPLDQWTPGLAVRGKNMSDDHMNLKTLQSDPQGRVYAVVKTSLDAVSGIKKSSAQINLLVFKPGTGSWTVSQVGTISDCQTRPIVMLDEENAQVDVFTTAPSGNGCSYAGQPGTIYEKTAKMSDLVFPPGRGTPVIRDASNANMNNVTSTKQSVNSRTGLVVLASNTSTGYYWHADLPIGAAQTPVAGFSANVTSGTAPLSVSFTDTSTGSPTSWSWDFGDGSTSTDQSPTHVFSTSGDFSVTLTASNSAGSSTPAAQTIHVVVPPAPTASFTATPTSGSTPLTVQFTDTSTGSPTSWSWDFGDGSGSTAQSPSHTYTTAGNYQVTLTATNSTGSSTTDPQTVTVSPPPAPTASFTATPTSGTVPLAVQFADTSTGPTSWLWDFGDGGSGTPSTTSTQQNPSFTFTTAGRYTVTLTATNGSGSTSTSQTITVAPQPTGNAIERASTASSVVTTATNGIDIQKPSGTQAGDLLVSCVTTNGYKPTSSGVPAGWQPIAAVTGVSNPHVFGYYKVAGASEPDSYHWTFNASITSSGGIARYTNAGGLDGAASTASGAAATSGTVPGVTTATDGAMLVGCMGVNSGSASLLITGPSTMGSMWDLLGKRQQAGDESVPFRTDTGSRTWKFSASREWAGWLVALRPSS